MNRLASLFLCLLLCVGTVVPLTGAGYSEIIIIDRVTVESIAMVEAIPDSGMIPTSEDADENTHTDAMLAEAEKYLGVRYVWGGAAPSTGFDCSGYVSWVLNHSGWNVGRLGAQALYDICTPISQSEAQPGDLVFFTKTYRAPLPVTHVGVYTGDGTMIHCGSNTGVTYASLNNSYWRQHYYGAGRLPLQSVSEV